MSLKTERASPGRLLHRLKNDLIFWFMLLPSLFVLIAVAYIPMFGIIVAFKDYNYRDGIFFSPWSGLRNFEFLFKSGKLGMLTSHTVLYNIVFIVTGTVAAVSIAIMISEIGSRHFKKITQSMIFLPNFMSWVIISTLLYNILHVDYGVLNTFLRAFGAPPVDVFTNAKVWYFLLPLLRIWKSAGFGSVIFFAAIMSIDQEFYESAKLDGAGRFQEIRFITLPMILPTIVILTLLDLGSILRGDFSMFYQLVGRNGLLFKTTDILDTFVFRALMHNNDIGLASAVGFYQSIFCFIVIMLVNRLVRWIQPEYALF